MALNPKLVVIAGPTSSGKTDLAIELAKKFNGEIVSADSRQVYKGMDIGSGKATKEQQQEVPHHLLDVVDPKDRFTVSDYKRFADEAIEDIVRRGKLPFLVGGTGLYIQVVVDNFEISTGEEDLAYREELEGKSLDELVVLLQKTDPESYDNIDLDNKRRVVRALEVNHTTGQSFFKEKKKGEASYDALMLGIDVSRDELYRRIDQRVDERITEGMIEEVQELLNGGVDEKRLYDFGQEYRFCLQYIQGEWETKEEMVQRLKYAIHGFARRQMTWFRKDKRIVWVKTNEKAIEEIQKFFVKK